MSRRDAVRKGSVPLAVGHARRDIRQSNITHCLPLEGEGALMIEIRRSFHQRKDLDPDEERWGVAALFPVLCMTRRREIQTPGPICTKCGVQVQPHANIITGR